MILLPGSARRNARAARRDAPRAQGRGRCAGTNRLDEVSRSRPDAAGVAGGTRGARHQARLVAKSAFNSLLDSLGCPGETYRPHESVTMEAGLTANATNSDACRPEITGT